MKQTDLNEDIIRHNILKEEDIIRHGHEVINDNLPEANKEKTLQEWNDKIQKLWEEYS